MVIIKRIYPYAFLLIGLASLFVGWDAEKSAITKDLNAAGAAIGAVVGGTIGSSIGLATAGVGIPATVPVAATGAVVGGHLGDGLAQLGIGVAPAWATPVKHIGAFIACIGLALILARLITFLRRKRSKQHAINRN